VAAARLLFGGAMSIQAPPNLTPAEGQGGDELAASWKALIDAGINDFGGISPITRDFVSPEKPWPHIQPLAAAVAATGRALLPRLPVYPAYALEPGAARWLDAEGGPHSVAAAVRRLSDGDGLLRDSWFAGLADAAPEAAAAAAAADAASTSAPAASSAAAAGLHAATPLPRLKQRAWRVALGADGCMEGLLRPRARRSPMWSTAI
jgi:FO synthase